MKSFFNTFLLVIIFSSVGCSDFRDIFESNIETPHTYKKTRKEEKQIVEIQQALSAINRELVRRNEAVEKVADDAEKTKLHDELELLRTERRSLEGLLNELVDEAKASERTELDEALSRARWLEQQQERWYQKEELTRDRKE